MDPFTLALIGSSALQAGSTIMGANKQYDAYKQQETEVLKTAIHNKQMVLAQGQVAAEQIQIRNKLKKGIEINKISGSGINDTGSAADVAAQNEYFGELDVYRTRKNYQMQADNYAYNVLNDVDNLESTAKEVRTNEMLSLVNIAAGTVSSYAMNGKYNQLNLNNMNNMVQQENTREAGINNINNFMYGNGTGTSSTGAGVTLYSSSNNPVSVSDLLNGNL